eukprot:SM000077S21571  [mRNA]  locus=s77:177007:180368:- [translate_table: standard]
MAAALAAVAPAAGPVRRPPAPRPLHVLLRSAAAGSARASGRRAGFAVQAAARSTGEDTEAPPAPVAAASGGAAAGPRRFLCPLLKLLSGGDAAAPRNRTLEVLTSGLASMARLPWGSQVKAAPGSKQPAKLLQVYEFEACPFCRRTREALTELDLSAEVYPCPKDSLRHREIVRSQGGKEQFPYLVDPNTGISMYESGDIVRSLFKEYGAGAQPTPGLLQSTLLTGWIPTVVRAGRGMSRHAKAAAQVPAQLLELYSYENNQFARLVREALCELELPYILHNVGKGSSRRSKLRQLDNSTQALLTILWNVCCWGPLLEKWEEDVTHVISNDLVIQFHQPFKGSLLVLF